MASTSALEARQADAYWKRQHAQFSSFRGAVALLVSMALLYLLGALGARSVPVVLFVLLPGYLMALICLAISGRSAYFALQRLSTLVLEATQSSPAGAKKDTSSPAADGLRQRKGFMAPEGLALPTTETKAPGIVYGTHIVKTSTPATISTNAELRAFQTPASSADLVEEAHLNFGFGMEMSSAINPNGLYSQAYAVMKPTMKPPVRKELESALSSAPHMEKALEVLAECRLKPRQMGDICDRLRQVLAQHLQDVLVSFLQNVDELVACGLRREMLLCEITVQPLLSVVMPGATEPTTFHQIALHDLLNACRADPLFVSKTRPNVHLLREYETFMKYFDVKEEYSKAYCIQRLRTLAEDGFLGQYRWDSGGAWKGKAWTKEANLPTDAELIMNLFCAMLDDVLPAVSDNDRPFRRAHYAPVPPTKSASIRGMFLIYYSQPSPPNFKVIANGQVREILPGKTNVFQSIVLFLRAIRQFKSGHLGNINLHILLEEIFES
ncbi:hypothetical protein SPRG_04246 [Saprolegnia parasitica CBS 223.65]|uniref:Transmembrane protein n=1 Tax=Saprolegnia parasitica (strain CBS 223.65) TaxID=695850 RepID=A0A067CWE0_SAPPC|nr:hypothetical protein SPRG_04246 [Saprolegnia parasitica CBS 223.65]KDO31107.1 hypothetical protein SPRG_04246 [Saprolegnia parasitica CBS 223.65]|eukprot:XP_012198236.1 hypothetical protein SPRG_04246 [Saprolegnia parasitica CBS 223.65]